jgi:predicted GIY-YIG superfamily endonuclease
MEKRLAEHQAGHFKGYTFKRRPVKLMWNDAFQTRDDAKAAETKIKGWSRGKKEALIARNWALISELSKNYTQHRQRKP